LTAVAGLQRASPSATLDKMIQYEITVGNLGDQLIEKGKRRIYDTL